MSGVIHLSSIPVLRKCFTYYSLQHQIATITKEGVTIENNIELDTNWEVANFVVGYE
jgi:hypothetical protein